MLPFTIAAFHKQALYCHKGLACEIQQFNTQVVPLTLDLLISDMKMLAVMKNDPTSLEVLIMVKCYLPWQHSASGHY
jgi:hypothetical protein